MAGALCVRCLDPGDFGLRQLERSIMGAKPAGTPSCSRTFRSGCTFGGMPTDDQKLTAVIHGEAIKFARDEVPQELLDL